MALTEADLVRKVRQRMQDHPPVILSAAQCLAADPTVTLATGHGARLDPGAGGVIEWDDGTGETDTVDSVSDDVATFGVRGYYGDAAVDHASGARILLSPRFHYALILDEVRGIVNTELWPHIWIPKETPLTYQSVNDYFSPTATDIARIVYAYQIVSGTIERYDAEFVPPREADDTNFPNGIVRLNPWGLRDSSTIYLAYRAIPTTTTLLDRHGPLVALGAQAMLTMGSESQRVSPDVSALTGRVAEGSRLRGGAVLFQRFEGRRTAERLRLENEESQGVHLVGALGG